MCAPGLDDLGDQADAQCLLRGHDPAGQDQVQGPPQSHHPRQALRAAIDQRHAPAALGKT